MERLRQILSIAYGVLIGIGMAWGGGGDQAWLGHRILIGLIFGAGTAFSMLKRPEQHTRKLVLFCHGPLIAGLVIWMALVERSAQAGWISAIGGALLLGISFALARVNERTAKDTQEGV